MTKQMRSTLDQASRQLGIAEQFCERYGARIPEGVGHMSVGDPVHKQAPSFAIFADLFHSGDADAEKRRSEAKRIAENAFGPEGWKREADRDRKGYAWRKTVDGVEVWIMGAELIANVPPAPVPATAFAYEYTKQALPPPAFDAATQFGALLEYMDKPEEVKVEVVGCERVRIYSDSLNTKGGATLYLKGRVSILELMPNEIDALYAASQAARKEGK